MQIFDIRSASFRILNKTYNNVDENTEILFPPFVASSQNTSNTCEYNAEVLLYEYVKIIDCDIISATTVRTTWGGYAGTNDTITIQSNSAQLLLGQARMLVVDKSQIQYRHGIYNIQIISSNASQITLKVLSIETEVPLSPSFNYNTTATDIFIIQDKLINTNVDFSLASFYTENSPYNNAEFSGFSANSFHINNLSSSYTANTYVIAENYQTPLYNQFFTVRYKAFRIYDFGQFYAVREDIDYSTSNSYPSLYDHNLFLHINFDKTTYLIKSYKLITSYTNQVVQSRNLIPHSYRPTLALDTSTNKLIVDVSSISYDSVIYCYIAVNKDFDSHTRNYVDIKQFINLHECTQVSSTIFETPLFAVNSLDIKPRYIAVFVFVKDGQIHISFSNEIQALQDDGDFFDEVYLHDPYSCEYTNRLSVGEATGVTAIIDLDRINMSSVPATDIISSLNCSIAAGYKDLLNNDVILEYFSDNFTIDANLSAINHLAHNKEYRALKRFYTSNKFIHPRTHTLFNISALPGIKPTRFFSSFESRIVASVSINYIESKKYLVINYNLPLTSKNNYIKEINTNPNAVYGFFRITASFLNRNFVATVNFSKNTFIYYDPIAVDENDVTEYLNVIRIQHRTDPCKPLSVAAYLFKNDIMESNIVAKKAVNYPQVNPYMAFLNYNFSCFIQPPYTIPNNLTNLFINFLTNSFYVDVYKDDLSPGEYKLLIVYTAVSAHECYGSYPFIFGANAALCENMCADGVLYYKFKIRPQVNFNIYSKEADCTAKFLVRDDLSRFSIITTADVSAEFLNITELTEDLTIIEYNSQYKDEFCKITKDVADICCVEYINDLEFFYDNYIEITSFFASRSSISRYDKINASSYYAFRGFFELTSVNTEDESYLLRTSLRKINIYTKKFLTCKITLLLTSQCELNRFLLINNADFHVVESNKNNFKEIYYVIFKSISFSKNVNVYVVNIDAEVVDNYYNFIDYTSAKNILR